MPAGDLTRRFGKPLVEILAGKFLAVHPSFPAERFRKVIPTLEALTLMQRVKAVAAALGPCLPNDLNESWNLMARILPPPLEEKQQVFNEGWWMLPLAAYWQLYGCPQPVEIDEPQGRARLEAMLGLSLEALGQLTQRGTAEYALRPFVQNHCARVLRAIHAWVRDPSLHVRRLASEGTRPYLPWAGKLNITRQEQKSFLDAITCLAWDESPYVRRSVGNHVRDWRRFAPETADEWMAAVDAPKDVLKRAARRT
jgi:3-methyladenine DNA glycosylase AlkC